MEPIKAIESNIRIELYCREAKVLVLKFLYNDEPMIPEYKNLKSFNESRSKDYDHIYMVKLNEINTYKNYVAIVSIKIKILKQG